MSGGTSNPARFEKSMKMAELVSASGVRKPTITSYVKLGLLPPPERVSPNLYLYDESHLKALLIIRKLREEGLSLSDIKQELDSPGTAPKSIHIDDIMASTKSGSTCNEGIGDKGQKIIEQAIKLFCVHGFENVTISDITNSVQIGKGTFYIYFKDKKDLLYACFEKITTLLPSTSINQDILQELDLVSQLKRRWLSFHAEYPHFPGIIQLLQSYLHSDDPAIRKRAVDAHIEIINPVKEDIIKAQNQGIIAPLDPELLAHAVLGIMQNVALRLNQDTTYTLEQAADVLEELVRRVLQPLGTC